MRIKVEQALEAAQSRVEGTGARVKTACHIEIDEGKEETRKLKQVAGVAFLMAERSGLRHIFSTDEKDETGMDVRDRCQHQNTPARPPPILSRVSLILDQSFPSRSSGTVIFYNHHISIIFNAGERAFAGFRRSSQYFHAPLLLIATGNSNSVKARLSCAPIGTSPPCSCA